MTFTPTSTGTPTATQIPKPYQVFVRVYNAAGELVKVILEEDSSQEVTSLTSTGSVITSLQGAGSTVSLDWNGNLLATWNGTNGAGQPVSNGVYFIRVDSVDSLGNVVSVGQAVTVSRTYQTVLVEILNEAGEVVDTLYSADGQAPVTSVQLSSSLLKLGPPGQGPLTIGMNNGVTLTWNGTGAGGAPLTSGVYYLEIFPANGTGTAPVITEILTVVDSGGTGAGVLACPNIWKPGDPPVTFDCFSSQPLTLKVRLYDLAGERITTFTGGAGTSQAVYDPNTLASGVYIALVESWDMSGTLTARQTLKIEVRH